MTDLRRSPAHGEHPDARESGVAMIGTLAVVIILGLLVTIVLATQQPASQNTTQETTSAGVPVTTTTVPKTVGSGAQEAAVSACQANFQAITVALTDYKALNGANPAAGSAWATSSAAGGPYMQAWPDGHAYYTIVWSGSTLNVVPLRGPASHGSMGTSTPATGCFGA